MINFYTAEGQRAAELASIDVEKNRDKAYFMAEIEVQKQQRLEAIRLDMQVKKDSLIRVVEQSDDGFWTVTTKVTDDTQYCHRFSDLRNVVAKWLQPVDKREHEKVLALEFFVGSANVRKICFFREKELTAKQFQKKLICAGVHFWVRERIKMELIDIFIASVCQMAEILEIPRKHGWYRSEGKWCYAGRETITWKEVEKSVK